MEADLIKLLSIDSTTLKAELCKRSFIDFVKFIDPKYVANWHHVRIANALEKFEAGIIKKLMICIPPQHGKSQLSTRTFPAWLLGKNPDRKIAVLSYSDTKAREFNRDIQRNIDNEFYYKVFPETRLGSSHVVSDSRVGVRRNSEIFDIVGHEGFLRTVGRGGALTGTSVDIAIIDDLYKDRDEAMSTAINSSIRSWWTDVVSTRFHNDSQVLALNTRWDINDWNSYVLTNEGDWTLISIPAIKENDMDPEDPRKIGEALWESKHSRERILKVKERTPFTFNSLYQQDPKPDTSTLVFPQWQVTEFWPDDGVRIFGQDYGFTNDPSALIEIIIVGRKIFVKEVFYEKGLVNKDIANRAILYGVGKAPVYADSAERKSNEELRRGYKDLGISGLNVIDTLKGPDSINAGINKLKEYDVFIHQSSKNIIRERNSYQWVVVGGQATNTPVDRDNHAIDAIRGAVYTYLARPRGAGLVTF